MAWLSGWKYRKSVTISRASGAVTDYQMKVIVGESSGAAGADVHCEGHFGNPGWADIRFTSSDGTTQLSYWFEADSGTTPNRLATMWIKCASIGTGATTFYLYYGKDDETSTQSGEDTFPFFDDFEGSSIDTDKWYHWLTNGAYSVHDHILEMLGGAGFNYWGSKTKFGVNYAYRGTVQVSVDNGGSNYPFIIDNRSADGSDGGTLNFGGVCNENGTKSYISQSDNVAPTYTARADSLAGAYNIVEIQRNDSTDIRFTLNDDLKVTHTTDVPVGDCGIAILSDYSLSSTYVHRVLVRKWYVTEPAFGSWGAEEDWSILGSVYDTLTVSESITTSVSDPGVSIIDTISVSESVSCDVEAAAAVSGTHVWGHDTGAEEAVVRDFSGNWAGTGSISGSTDEEVLVIEAGNYMESENAQVGAGYVVIALNKYRSGTLFPVRKYKTAAIEADLAALGWTAYTDQFYCEGWAKIRLEA